MKNNILRSRLSGLIPLISAIFLGLFFRTYQLFERFMYNHDNDLSAWIIKDIVIDHHIRLIGQLTSSPGIFIGPLFYYALIPFYWLSGWNPMGSVWFSVIIGLLSIFSVYYVFRRLFSRQTAGFGAFLYAASFNISGTEREVVPTTPVSLWTIWFFYALYQLNSGKKSGIWLIFILGALIWQLNLALALLLPLPFLLLILRRRYYKWSDFIRPVLLALILSIPLFLFEIRHDFNQVRALFATLTNMGGGNTDYLAKFFHVGFYMVRNATWIFFWNLPPTISPLLIPVLLFTGFLFLQFYKLLPRFTLFIYPLWLLLYLVFFTFHPINLSEYYLNGLNILWLSLAAGLLAYLYSKGKYSRYMAIFICLLFFISNTYMLITTPVNHSGYLERTALVEYIKKDASAHHYPCISISYITTIGNNLGYRYLFYLSNLHVNNPDSSSPVYSIVFPHSLVDHIDKSFGSLGLILPDYSRYNLAAVKESCSGQNSNLTDPMFGFTK